MTQNPDISYRLGSTGDSPVLPGHWPGGRSEAPG